MTSVVSGILLGVDTSRVEAIEDLAPGNAVEGGVVDIARVWGMSVPAVDSPRRVLVLTLRGGLRRLMVGERVRLQTIRQADLCVMPAFVGEVTRQAAIRCPFLVDSSVGYLLDVDQLAQCV